MGMLVKDMMFHCVCCRSSEDLIDSMASKINKSALNITNLSGEQISGALTTHTKIITMGVDGYAKCLNCNHHFTVYMSTKTCETP